MTSCAVNNSEVWQIEKKKAANKTAKKKAELEAKKKQLEGEKHVKELEIIEIIF